MAALKRVDQRPRQAQTFIAAISCAMGLAAASYVRVELVVGVIVWTAFYLCTPRDSARVEFYSGASVSVVPCRCQRRDVRGGEISSLESSSQPEMTVLRRGGSSSEQKG